MDAAPAVSSCGIEDICAYAVMTGMGTGSNMVQKETSRCNHKIKSPLGKNPTAIFHAIINSQTILKNWANNPDYNKDGIIVTLEVFAWRNGKRLEKN